MVKTAPAKNVTGKVRLYCIHISWAKTREPKNIIVTKKWSNQNSHTLLFGNVNWSTIMEDKSGKI